MSTAIEFKYSTEQEVIAHLAKDGLTIEQVRERYRRKFPRWGEQKIQEELELGPLLEKVLDGFKRLAHAHPEVFDDEEELEECDSLT